MSVIETYFTHTCTIIRAGTPNIWGTTVAGSRTTVACRYQPEAKQVALADGALARTHATVALPAHTTVALGDTLVITGDDTPYRVLALETIANLAGPDHIRARVG